MDQEPVFNEKLTKAYLKAFIDAQLNAVASDFFYAHKELLPLVRAKGRKTFITRVSVLTARTDFLGGSYLLSHSNINEVGLRNHPDGVKCSQEVLDQAVELFMQECKAMLDEAIERRKATNLADIKAQFVRKGSWAQAVWDAIEKSGGDPYNDIGDSDLVRSIRYGTKFDRGIHNESLMEKHGCKCAICGAPVARGDINLYPFAATTGHIIPMSRGGDHTWENTRVECITCNKAKGTKLDIECDLDTIAKLSRRKMREFSVTYMEVFTEINGEYRRDITISPSPDNAAWLDKSNEQEANGIRVFAKSWFLNDQHFAPNERRHGTTD